MVRLRFDTRHVAAENSIHGRAEPLRKGDHQSRPEGPYRREQRSRADTGIVAQNFGPEGLIGKPLASISDARLSGRAEQTAVVVERLLSISGEDIQTIDRKHKPPVHVTLPTRLMILTNELPRLPDASRALPNRMIVLTLEQSFLGREDTTLTEQLKAELPGILRWAIAGWKRLRRQKRFTQPAASRGAAQELGDLASPVSQFIRERCKLPTPDEDRDDFVVDKNEIFRTWKAWCEASQEKGKDSGGMLRRSAATCEPWSRPSSDTSQGTKTAFSRTSTRD